MPRRWFSRKATVRVGQDVSAVFRPGEQWAAGNSASLAFHVRSELPADNDDDPSTVLGARNGRES
jgi:hypothetical protein